jgi:hypothetical protein
MASKKMMVPMDSPADDSERMMGAMQYIRKKYGNKFNTEGYKSPREFIASAKDVISESDISDMYPENVWSKAADKLLMGVWSKRKMKITRK